MRVPRKLTVNLHLDGAGNILSVGAVRYDHRQEVDGLWAYHPEPFQSADDVVRLAVEHFIPPQLPFDQALPAETPWPEDLPAEG